jgi:hypothetical protein
MRTLGLSLLTLVSMSAVAAAQPALTSSTPAPASAAPSTYLQLDGMAGTVGEDLSASAAIAGGVELGDSPLWVHGELLHGDTSGFLIDRNGTIDQARLGLEARSCGVRGIVCVMAGVDAAVEHSRVTGSGVNLFEVGPSDPVMTTEATTGLGIARIGLDIGGKHLRYRPGIEVAFDAHGEQAASVVQSVAWRF